ncbi:MAG TPA: response regulator [Aggregatilineales bacterium]|nr:response regulator [Anaerolineales bacterium]HRE48044.1 response regulator [Aggregatilineales bacterium]
MPYILLVEDNQSNADYAIRVLSAAGYQVKHVLRGLEAPPMARQERPSLILMDFDLPDIDGRTMILLLRKQLEGITPQPPIVALTARTSAMDQRIAARLGCAAFVGKPFTPDILVNIVQTLLKTKQPSAESPPPS